MVMKNPSHPGRLIKADLDALGLTVAEAAEGLGITRQQLYRVIRGESGVSAEMALRLEKAIGGDAGLWVRMQANFDVAQARLHNAQMQVRKLKAKAA